MRTRLALAATLAAALACARRTPPAPAPTPTTTEPAERVGLPPVPRVDGPLAIRVVSPGQDQALGRLDSTFVFGAVGSGDATLRINGTAVPVAPNGAFLAFLPVPPASAPRYELVASRGADTVRRAVGVRVAPRRVLSLTGPLAVDEESLGPAESLSLRGDEPVRVTLRAPRNAAVWLAADSERIPLVDLAAARGQPSSDEATTWVTEVPARTIARARSARVIAARGRDTVRLRPLRVTLADRPGTGPDSALLSRDYVMLGRPDVAADTDRVIIGRPVPGGFYKWFFLPGTVVERTGVQGEFTRVRLDGRLEVWVPNGDVVALPPGAAPSRRVVGNVRLTPAADWVDLTFGTGDRPPYEIIERGNELELLLFGTQLTPEILPIIGNDTLVKQIAWTQDATDRAKVTLQLSRAPYGYLVLYDAARGLFTLRLRRTPTIDPRQPLKGLTIAVDPGHPPGGATGGTGLTEPVAVLPVGFLVRDMLQARGATVVMTRTTADPVGLVDRAIATRRANAHVFVSIHLNAFGDGTNPFANFGTSTLFYHQHSEPLARYVERELVKRFRIPDLGVHYQNLAVARPTWYPAVLTEGLFLMFPEQENAMRTPAGRELYARGIVAGLESYFRDLASGR
jgi:N-acetylmuramoyl-L-alanine amidase